MGIGIGIYTNIDIVMGIGLGLGIYTNIDLNLDMDLNIHCMYRLKC